MRSRIFNQILRSDRESGDADALDGRDARGSCPEAVVAIGAGAFSGFVVGLLVDGQFTTGALVFLMLIAGVVVGWWARKVVVE